MRIRIIVLLLALCPGLALAQETPEQQVERLRLQARRLRIEAELQKLEAAQRELHARRLELQAELILLGQREAAAKAGSASTSPHQPKPVEPAEPPQPSTANALRERIKALLVRAGIDPIIQRAVAQHTKSSGSPPSAEEQARYRAQLEQALLRDLGRVFDDATCARIGEALSGSADQQIKRHAKERSKLQRILAVAEQKNLDLPRVVTVLLNDQAALNKDPLKLLVLTTLLEHRLRSVATDQRPSNEHSPTRDEADRRFAQAQRAYEANQPEQAARLLRTLLQNHPKHDDALQLRKTIVRKVTLRYAIAHQKWRDDGDGPAFLSTASRLRNISRLLAQDSSLLARINKTLEQASRTLSPEASAQWASATAIAGQRVDAAKHLRAALLRSPEHTALKALNTQWISEASQTYQRAKTRWQQGGSAADFVREASIDYHVLQTLAPKHALISMFASDLARANASTR